MSPISRRSTFNLVLLAAVVLLTMQISLVLAEPAAPTDPGGIGTTHLVAWFDGGVGTFSGTDCTTASISGGEVACWVDQSSNGLQAVQLGVGRQPIWETNQLNLLPVVRFDGSNDALSSSIDSLNTAFPTTDTTVFVVQRTTTVHQGSTFSAAAVDINNRFNAFIPSSDSMVYWEMGDADSGDGQLTFASFSDTSSFYLWGFGMDSGSGQAIYQNGASKANDATADAFDPTGKSLFLGASDTSSNFFAGDIAELIIYNNVLSDTNRTHVELYLRDKFDLDLSDTAIYSAPEAYNHNVRGISMSADVSDSDRNSATAGLRVVNDSFLQDADDVMVFGHNNAPFALVSDGLADSAANTRWARLWSFDVNDDPGTLYGRVFLTFDISDAGGGGVFASDGSYYLLKRSTGSSDNFTDVTPVSAPVISGDQITFQVSVTDLGSEFTLGSLDSPLAIDLASFSVGSGMGQGIVLAAILFMALITLILLLRRGKEQN